MDIKSWILNSYIYVRFSAAPAQALIDHSTIVTASSVELASPSSTGDCMDAVIVTAIIMQ